MTPVLKFNDSITKIKDDPGIDKYYLMAVKEWISVAPNEEVKDTMENPHNPYVSVSEREKFLEAVRILKGE